MAKKIVAIEVEGKEKHIRLGMNALIELEGILGKPITAIGGSAVSLSDLRAMLYVGLKWEDKKLTLETVGDYMDSIIEEKGIEYLSDKLGEALQGSVGSSALPSK